jgi:hypothetical protein
MLNDQVVKSLQMIFFVTSQNSNELDKLLKSQYDFKLRYNYGSYNFSSLKKGRNILVEKSPNL